MRNRFLEAAIKRARFYLILMHEQKPIHVLVYRQLRYELLKVSTPSTFVSVHSVGTVVTSTSFTSSDYTLFWHVVFPLTVDAERLLFQFGISHTIII